MDQLETMFVDVHLDEGAVTEILVRLPARSVLRFRAVCTDWLRITTCPSFLAAHARRRPLEVLLYTRTTLAPPPRQESRWGVAPLPWLIPPPLPRHPFMDEAEERFIAGIYAPTPDVSLELDALPVAAHRPPQAGRRLARYPADAGVDRLLLASLDGLLLLRGGVVRGSEQYLVCNPLTRQWSDLPRLVCDAGIHAQYRESGFYFHQPSREYRLLCHGTLRGLHSSEPVGLGYYVFSAGADEPRRLSTQATPLWNTMVTQLPERLKAGFYDNLMTPALLHGHLHWMQHMEAELTDEMVAFDTATETFRRMPPPPLTSKYRENSHLVAADGLLMASELGHLFVDLWVLQGYDGGAAPGTWEQLHRVSLEVPCHTNSRLLLATDGDGADVIVGTPGGVVAYNVRSGTTRHVADIDSSRSDTVSPSRFVFRESLVRHRFFEVRPHPGLQVFSFCACV